MGNLLVNFVFVLCQLAWLAYLAAIFVFVAVLTYNFLRMLARTSGTLWRAGSRHVRNPGSRAAV